MWMDYGLIAEVRGGLIGADALKDDDLLGSDGGILNTPSGRDAWVAGLSKLRDENDKEEIERQRAREEESQKRRARVRRIARMHGQTPLPDTRLNEGRAS